MRQKKSTAPKVNKGAPSGVIVSLALHAAAFTLAGLLVVFTVVQKEEKKFVPPKPVDRPKMKLKKPKVKVKKNNKPKATTRIVTKVKRASMPDIQLPEMSGMADGLAGGIAGFELVPDLGEISVLGSGQSIGNDFEGTFYDLKRDRNGGIIAMDGEQFLLILRNFATSGWRTSKFSRFWRAPKKLYTTHIMVPPIVAPKAPDFFGQPEVESYYFFVHYKGQIAHKEDIKFRFWGVGDAYILVNVDGENVFINGVEARLDILDYWQTSSADSYKYYLADKTMKVGDWITLKAGEAVDMQVIFGEWAGGIVSGMLLVEVDGVEYPETRQGGPLLPAFKTQEFSLDTLEQITKYLPEGECNLTNGPVFRDY